MKKIFLFCIFAFISLFTISALEWPQDEHEPASITSYFGQNVGDSLSTSIVFKDPQDVKAVKDGHVLIIMSDFNDDSEFFPSTLGSSIILAHDDGLISVYGNLDDETVSESLKNKTSVREGATIAQTGNSGWQNTRSNLEFQIIDTQKSAAINPKILLPRTDNEISLYIKNVVLQNKDGEFIDINSKQKVFQTGLYRIYEKRDLIATPYKTLVTINGVVVDEISYDTINEENSKLYVVGKKKYIKTDIYPNDDYLLLGEVMLTNGKSTLGLTVSDFLGEQKSVAYTISAY